MRIERPARMGSPPLPGQMPASSYSRVDRALKFRWLIPLLFPYGYLRTAKIFADHSEEYALLTISSFLLCGLVLTRLGKPIAFKLPIWVILASFLLAYYAKFYTVITSPDLMEKTFLSRVLLSGRTRVYLDTFKALTLSFGLFCVSSWMLLFPVRKRILSLTGSRPINPKKIVWLLARIIPALMVVTFGVMALTHIGRMGMHHERLPFRIGGWIVHIRQILLPALALTMIWCCEQAKMRKQAIYGVVLLFVHAFSEMVITTGRGSLILMFSMLMFLLFVTGNLTKKHVILFVVAVIATAALWPILTSGRFLWAKQSDESIVDYVSEAGARTYGPRSPLEVIGESVRMLFFRLTGIDGLFVVCSQEFKPMGLKVLNTSVNDYYKVTILRYDAEYARGFAPSLLGWFHIVGGEWLGIFGIVFYTVIIWTIWWMLWKARLASRSVAASLVLFFVFQTGISGNLDRIFLQVATLGGSVVICEWLVRSFGGRASGRGRIPGRPFAVAPHLLKGEAG